MTDAQKNTRSRYDGSFGPDDDVFGVEGDADNEQIDEDRDEQKTIERAVLRGTVGWKSFKKDARRVVLDPHHYHTDYFKKTYKQLAKQNCQPNGVFLTFHVFRDQVRVHHPVQPLSPQIVVAAIDAQVLKRQFFVLFLFVRIIVRLWNGNQYFWMRFFFLVTSFRARTWCLLANLSRFFRSLRHGKLFYGFTSVDLASPFVSFSNTKLLLSFFN